MTAREIHVLRHAKSSWADVSLDDHDRPLAGRGRRAVKALARHLEEEGIAPELVLCSSALRTRQTLEGIRPALGKPVVEIEPALYGASARQLRERLRALPDDVATVMLIGHNPGVEDLVLDLAKSLPELAEIEAKFPTGALATLTFSGKRWADLDSGTAQLAGWVRPRDLKSY